MPWHKFWIWPWLQARMSLIFDHIIPAPLADHAGAASFWRSRVEVNPGEHFAIIAASGRGKSTLVNIAYGIRQDYTGHYLINGKKAHTLKQEEWALLRQDVFSCVFQDLKLFPTLTARQNILLKTQLSGIIDFSEAEDMAERLGVKNLLDKPCGQLSMGQQQRIAVLRALCQPFQYLFLDEPTSHLDKENAAALLNLVMEKAGQKGAAVFITGLDQDYPLPATFHHLMI